MGERSDLDALAAGLDAYGPAPAGWTDELWDLYERAEAAARVPRVRPEGWTDELWEGYLRDEVPEPPPPLTAEQRELFDRERERERVASALQRLLESLGERREVSGLSDPARAAALAERWVRAGLPAHPGMRFLDELGVPEGEAALLRLVADESLDREDRQEARSRLLALRRPRNRARGREPQEGETPLLPPAVRELADAWGMDGRRPPRHPVDREDVAAVRAALEALLPAERLPVPEPPPELPDQEYDDEEAEPRPDWVDVRILLRDLMPHPRTVTRERMADVRREAERLGLAAGDGFAEEWTVRIGAWIAGAMFDWLAEVKREPHDLAPWAADLAERYVLRGYAAEDARRFLDRCS
ncbi:hypothetical protein [Streptomyces sp. NPDC057682]|uniref:hypothetical protein n=1 Tax=Streptomyces sp. NPDC057682 TaxID=3346210 RepID=UPI0036CC04DE